MKKIDTSDWSEVQVELCSGRIIADRILDSKEEFEDFCLQYGYKLISFTRGTNPLCR